MHHLIQEAQDPVKLGERTQLAKLEPVVERQLVCSEQMVGLQLGVLVGLVVQIVPVEQSW